MSFLEMRGWCEGFILVSWKFTWGYHTHLIKTTVFVCHCRAHVWATPRYLLHKHILYMIYIYIHYVIYESIWDYYMIWYSMILHSMYISLTLYDVGWFDQNLQISPHHIHMFGLRAAILGVESTDVNNSFSGWNVGLDSICTPKLFPHKSKYMNVIIWLRSLGVGVLQSYRCESCF